MEFWLLRREGRSVLGLWALEFRALRVFWYQGCELRV